MMEISSATSELSVVQPLRFLVVESAYPSSSPKLSTSARIFLNLLKYLTCVILSVVSNMTLDSEASVVNPSILKIYRLSLLELLVEKSCASASILCVFLKK